MLKFEFFDISIYFEVSLQYVKYDYIYKKDDELGSNLNEAVNHEEECYDPAISFDLFILNIINQSLIQLDKLVH